MKRDKPYNYNGTIIRNQTELFEFVWNTRDHLSEVSGKPLPYKGHPQHHWIYAHILAKGPYPQYKLNPENIILLTPEEHDLQETFLEFRERKEKLKQKYYSENQIKKL